jgi:phage repressor protein C with HTH and peptisase S24 domain
MICGRSPVSVKGHYPHDLRVEYGHSGWAMARLPTTLVDRIDARLESLQRNDREISIQASGKPDLIRDIRRGRAPRADRLAQLADALQTTPDYLLGRSEVPAANGQPVDEAPFTAIASLARDLPVYGTALGADVDFIRVEDGAGPVAIEQSTVDMAGAIDYMRRPPRLENNRDAYAVITVGESMYPRFRHGEYLLVDPRRPPSIGDDVVIQLRAPSDDGDRVVSVLIKTLSRRTASHLELEQFNPPAIFRVPMSAVAAIHRVTAWSEVMSI